MLTASSASTARAQGGLVIGEQVVHSVESPHPYPEGSPPGTLVWDHVIHHPGAAGLWVHLASLDLAPGDWLVVRNGDSTDSETFTSQGRLDLGTFWSAALAGDTLVVEIWSDGGTTSSGVTIDRYAWAYTDPIEGSVIESAPAVDRDAPADAPRRWEGEVTPPPSPAAICGSVDLEDAVCQAVAEPFVVERARAVARLEIFTDDGVVSACTGWLASCSGHLVTNWHCIDSATEAMSANYEFLAERTTCRSPIPLGCGFLEGPRGTIYTGASLVATDANLDVALVQVPGDPQLDFGWLEIEPAPVAIGQRIYIPQHAGACSKQVGIIDTELATGVCEITSVTEAPCIGGAQQELGYSCDTRGGSSGSPVLRHDTHRVVGLHHCAGAGGGCSNPNRAVPIAPIASIIDPLLGATDIPDEVAMLGVTKEGPFATDLGLSWSAASGAATYRVYRGTLGVVPPGAYDHAADDVTGLGDCSVPVTSRTFPGEAAYLDGSADFYYLVVGVAACGGEGPYGTGTVNGTRNPPVPRPAGVANCP